MAISLDHLQGATDPSTGTWTLTNAVTAGALLVIGAGSFGGSVTGGSVSDGTHTYTLTLDATVRNVGSNIPVSFLYCICTSGLSTGATVTPTGGANIVVAALSATGVASSSFLVASAGADAASSFNWSTPSIDTTGTNGCLIISYCAVTGASGTNTPNSPALDGGQDGNFCALQYDIQTTGGSGTSRGGAWSGGHSATAAIAAFKPAAAAAAFIPRVIGYWTE